MAIESPNIRSTSLTGQLAQFPPHPVQNPQNPQWAEAENHYQQGQSLMRLGSVSLAAFHFEAAARLYHAAGDPLGHQTSLIDLSFARYRLTDYPRAKRHLFEAERINTAAISNSATQQARVNLIRGLILLDEGNILTAWQKLRQAQVTLASNPVERPRLNIALGEIYRHTGQYSWALSTLQNAINQSQDRVDRAKAQGAIGNIYYDLGDYEEATIAYETALSQSRALGDYVGVVRHLNGLGRVYLQQQTYDQALQVYLEAYNLASSQGYLDDLSYTLNNLGELYAEQGDLDKARETYTEALGFSNNIGPHYSRSLNHLGQIHLLQHNRSKALELFEEAFRWAEGSQDQSGQINALSGLAETHWKMGDLQQAQTLLYDALDRVEALNPGLVDYNKVSLFETQAYLYELLQEILIEQDDVESALVVAERGRARAFAELLATQTPEVNAITEVPAMTMAEIKALAQTQNTTFIQYSVIRQPSPGRSRFEDQAVFIWVIQPTGEIHFEQVDLSQRSDSLKEMISTGQENLGVRGFSPWFSGSVTQLSQASLSTETDLEQLSTLLIAPIAQYLPTAETDKVIFIPHRELFLIPFPALHNDRGQYLIEAHTLGNAPSLQTLALLQQRSRQQTGDAVVVGIDRATLREAVIVGNPQMPSLSPQVGEPARPLSSLPGAEAEALAIAPLLNTDPLLGTAATETAVRARLDKADIIHLATHGLLDEQQGLSSAIALTPTATVSNDFRYQDQPDDGLLTAQEVMDLNLTADLVVLSACNTGRGRITGDGVVGLSRAFLAAGAQNLVASLWAVPDEATAVLMTEFYQQLQTEPDKATALRQAMLNTMANHPEPKDWAAFFLIGL